MINQAGCTENVYLPYFFELSTACCLSGAECILQNMLVVMEEK